MQKHIQMAGRQPSDLCAAGIIYSSSRWRICCNFSCPASNWWIL